MGTLDKLWGTIAEEDEDTKMTDMEDKSEGRLMNHRKSKEKSTKQPTTATRELFEKDIQENKPTQPERQRQEENLLHFFII